MMNTLASFLVTPIAALIIIGIYYFLIYISGLPKAGNKPINNKMSDYQKRDIQIDNRHFSEKKPWVEAIAIITTLSLPVLAFFTNRNPLTGRIVQNAMQDIDITYLNNDYLAKIFFMASFIGIIIIAIFGISDWLLFEISLNERKGKKKSEYSHIKFSHMVFTMIIGYGVLAFIFQSHMFPFMLVFALGVLYLTLDKFSSMGAKISRMFTREAYYIRIIIVNVFFISVIVLSLTFSINTVEPVYSFLNLSSITDFEWIIMSQSEFYFLMSLFVYGVIANVIIGLYTFIHSIVYVISYRVRKKV